MSSACCRSTRCSIGCAIARAWRRSSSSTAAPPPSERRALLDAIAEATNRPNARVRLGAALDPLFPEEPDASLRASMIRRVADRAEPASARALGRWLGRVHGAERRRVLEALRRLEHLGMRRGARSLEAWVSGVDATGSFNVGISFPGPLELRDILLACISVDAGLRAVNVITAVGADTAGEIGRALEEGQAIPIAPLDVAAALRHIESAQAPHDGARPHAPRRIRRRRSLPPSTAGRRAGRRDPPRAAPPPVLDLPTRRCSTFRRTDRGRSATRSCRCRGVSLRTSRCRRIGCEQPCAPRCASLEGKRGGGATGGDAAASERSPPAALRVHPGGPQPRRRPRDRGATALPPAPSHAVWSSGRCSRPWCAARRLRAPTCATSSSAASSKARRCAGAPWRCSTSPRSSTASSKTPNERCAPGDRLTLAQMEVVCARAQRRRAPWSSPATRPSSRACPAWKVRNARR